MRAFSFEVKEEILAKRYESFCCASSSLAAIVQTLGEIVFRNGKMTVAFSIDHDDMFGFVLDTIEKFYGEIDENTEVHTKKIIGKDKREIVLDPNLGSRILFDTEIVTHEDGALKINHNLEKTLVLEDCCKIAYLSHFFCGSGTVSLPSEGGAGYHMEWSTANKETADDIASLLAHFGIFPKTVVRGEKFVVYVKDRESISDVLGRFGAVKSMLKLVEAQAERDLRNRINRGANCMTANISKTVDASAKHLAAISAIEETVGLNSLTPALKEVALARKNDPSASLSGLAEALGTKKSTVRTRLDSILKIAENLE